MFPAFPNFGVGMYEFIMSLLTVVGYSIVLQVWNDLIEWVMIFIESFNGMLDSDHRAMLPYICVLISDGMF